MRRGSRWSGGWWTVLGLVCLPCLGASAATPGELRATEARIEAAYQARDAEALQAIIDELPDAVGSDWWGRYYAALANYRLGVAAAQDEDRARDALNRCIDELKALTSEAGIAADQAAEAGALLAACYGNSAAYYALRAPVRGRRSQAALDRALELGASNPRVLLIDGLAYFSRPAIFGGSKTRARDQFDGAVRSFAERPEPGPGEPGWGRAEAWFFLAAARAQTDDPAGARKALARALELAPGYRDALELQAQLPAAVDEGAGP